MQKVSNEYKASMKSSLRERSYMMISFGLVNQEAQANATVMGNNFAYYSKQTGLFAKGAGSIFTFEVKGGVKEAQAFIDNLQIFSLLANVADVKSLVIHPATTTTPV